MRATELKGKPVTCLARGRRIGSVQTVILDPVEGRIAGLKVRTGFFEPPWMAAADLIQSIGADAIRVDSSRVASAASAERLGHLPDLGQLSHTRVVTASGEMVGSIRDALVDPLSLMIVGYEVHRPHRDERTYGRLVILVSERLHFGDGLLIIPDEALGPDAGPVAEQPLYYE
ncbi:MAG: PRC-barrel domain-containing protein [Chloroflexi bacterium]|nr:PRC-barrel domain-containing protein [Chloroflexota bacterium]